MSSPNHQNTHLASSVSAAPESGSNLQVAPETTAQLPITPQQTPSANAVLVGSLNAKSPMYYFKATASQLRLIIQSAPDEVKSRIRANASKETMLEEIFTLRQKEALETQQEQLAGPDPKESLSKILTLSSQEAQNAAYTDTDQLRQTMEAALKADPTITPRVVPENPQDIFITILRWQVDAHRIAQANAADQTTAANQPQPTPVRDTPPPQGNNDTQQGAPPNEIERNTERPAVDTAEIPTLADILASNQPRGSGQRRTDQEEDESDDENENRRKKPKKGIPLDSWIEGFQTGADAALEQILSTYPGKRPGANRLSVTSIRGPRILGRIIAKNTDLQEHVADFPYWKRTASGKPTQAHMEAHNLARTMQLEILAHKSPMEALRHRPSLEVSLRRLYAIMYVEKQIATGEVQDRGTAWNNIQFLLESTPDETTFDDDIEEELTRRLTLSRRRITATKAIKESDNRRKQRDPNKAAGRKGQGNNNRANQKPKLD